MSFAQYNSLPEVHSMEPNKAYVCAKCGKSFAKIETNSANTEKSDALLRTLIENTILSSPDQHHVHTTLFIPFRE